MTEGTVRFILHRQNPEKGNQFDTVKVWVHNPMQGWPKEKIATAVLNKYGHGKYFFFRFENMIPVPGKRPALGRLPIWQGVV